ncbi:MAG: hypothetical protein AABM33_01515 [Pseudomonadota bacterium]
MTRNSILVLIGSVFLAACAGTGDRKEYAAKTGTQLWVNHDKEQHASITKAPAYVE